VLLGYGPLLSKKLEAESTMQWDLASAGHRFFLEPKARIFHTNFELFFASLRCHFNGSRLFASNRRRNWGLCRQTTYFFGSPLIPLVRLVKCIGSLRRIGRLTMLPRLSPSLISLLLAGGVGEMFGYGFGPGQSVEYLTGIEFHRERFLRRSQYAPDTKEISADS
jgi:hypothetical protein